MPEPLPVTVVIPAYNAAAYLADALDSVRLQTAPAQEIIVVDDGSADDTAAIAHRFGARVISGPNGGLAHARNVGIRASVTPWIAFLDADDMWRGERLERQWRALAAAPGPLVVASDYTYFVDERIVVDAVLPTFPQYRAMARRAVAPGVSLARGTDLGRAMLGGNFVPPSTLLVDRRVFSEFNEYFLVRELLPDGGAEFFVGEDYEWYLRLLRHTDVLFVEAPLLDYRRSPTSLSANGGRLKHGDVVLGEFVGASPERYVAGIAEDLARVRPARLFDAGMRYLKEGDVVRARVMFARAMGAGHRRAIVFFTATFPFAAVQPGRRLFAAMFRLWRTRVRPLFRSATY